ncbi:MAG: YggS family pyridoxal phosphate-dependent enzyme [Clostridiales bacterium]|jgi:pyridoxal phosphate enzyme (YggS family)|nr:YggS family pyridoxal phosphate-dependent enzyme [Clostridiales bacterium]
MDEAESKSAFLSERIGSIKAKIEAARLAGGFYEPVTVVAATKTVDASVLKLLPGAGIAIAGENRVQELLEKYGDGIGLDWHFIGALQTNKVKYIADKVSLIHSVDRVGLADEIERRADALGRVIDVLVEVNIGGEPNKSGVSEADAPALVRYIRGLSCVRIRGLMTVMPLNAPDILYKRMRTLYNEMKTGDGFCYLSMGMSGDYEAAVRFGANMVRIGSAIFGARKAAAGQNHSEIR